MGNSKSEYKHIMRKLITLLFLILFSIKGFSQVKTFLNYSINDIKFDAYSNYYTTEVGVNNQLIKNNNFALLGKNYPSWAMGRDNLTVDNFTFYASQYGDYANFGDLSLNTPKGIGIDLYGVVYTADSHNNRIRVVNQISNPVSIYSKVSGSISGTDFTMNLNNPDGIAFDSYNNLYFTDALTNRIIKIDNKGNATIFVNRSAIQGFSGDGDSAYKAALYAPTKIAFDSYDNLYICDSKNNKIRVVKNGIISTFAGNGKIGFSGDGGLATNASFYFPTGICIDYYDNVYIADSHNSRVRLIKTDGTIHTIVGNGKQGLTGDSLYNPTQVSLDNDYKLYIVCQNNVA